jgi:2-desacetyl-2-hydroxyethyl bacteriochlorophyllide A dehydrogenase
MTEYKKIFISAPDEVKCITDTIDDTDIPDGKVLIRTMYSTISTGTELACISGKERWFPLPGVPGYSAVGQIVGVGAGVSEFECGDLVFCNGKHAQMQYCQAVGESMYMIKLPKGIELCVAPYIRMAGIAITGIRNSDIEIGDKVMVIGLGLMGNFAAQLAKMQGADVLCVEPCDNRIEIARQCGLKNVVSPKDSEFDVKVKDFTNGKGMNTVIDATGNPAVIMSHYKYVGYKGELILLGSPRGSFETDVTGILRQVHTFATDITIKGAHENRFPTQETMFLKHSRIRNIKIVAELIRNGSLVVKPMISLLAKPEEVALAYDRLKNHADEYMSITFDWAK